MKGDELPPPEPPPQPEPGDELRIYIIVRKDVGHWISKAKFGVQCGHATLMLFVECLKLDPERAWAYANAMQPKIVMQCRDTEDLLKHYEASIKAKFFCEKVTDAGRTEFDRPTLSAIAVGPVWHKMEARQSFLKRLQVYKDESAEEASNRFLDLLQTAPAKEIAINACIELNRGASCCLAPSVMPASCGHGAWNEDFGKEVVYQTKQWMQEQIKTRSN